MSEEARTLAEVARLLSGGTPTKSNPAYWGGETPWISAKDMKSIRIADAPDHVTSEGLQNGTRLAPRGAVLVLVRGMTLLNDVPICVAARPVAFNQDVKAIIADDAIDPTYLLYVLLSAKPVLLASVELAGHGTGRLPTDVLQRLPVRLPPLPEQQAIAEVLGALDDKIELNERMNSTLDGLARALFKSWFVDFDPVRTKAEGRQPSAMDAATAALFPDSFEDSTLGPIPAGWKWAGLGDFLRVLETGSRPRGGIGSYRSGVPSVGAESIKRVGDFDYSKTKYVPLAFFESMRRGHVTDRDVLLYKDGGRPGEFEPHATLVGGGFPFEQFAINEHVYRLRGVDGVPQTYLYYYLESDGGREEMRRRGTGVAIPGLNSSAVRALNLIAPEPMLLATFDEVVGPLVDLILANSIQSRTLTELRDALLPKLISGELRVRELARDVEAVV